MHSWLFHDGDHAQSGETASGEEVYLRSVGGWTVSSEGRENISVRADRGGIRISRIECSGGESGDYCSLSLPMHHRSADAWWAVPRSAIPPSLFCSCDETWRNRFSCSLHLCFLRDGQSVS